MNKKSFCQCVFLAAIQIHSEKEREKKNQESEVCMSQMGAIRWDD